MPDEQYELYEQNKVKRAPENRSLSHPIKGRSVSRTGLVFKGPHGQSVNDANIELDFYGPGGDYIHRFVPIGLNPWEYKPDFELLLGNYYLHYRYHLRNGNESYWYDSGVFTITP